MYNGKFCQEIILLQFKAMRLLLLGMMLKLGGGDGARILLVSPQLTSHVMMQSAIGEQLMRRGHEVFVVIGSTFPKAESLKQLGLQTLTYHVPDVHSGLSNDMEKILGERIFSADFDMLKMATVTSAVVSKDCDFMLSDNEFMQQVRALKFDIAIVEPFIINPCDVLLPHNVNVPFVSLANNYLPWIIRMPAIPSFYRDPSPVSTGSEPTFWNAVWNSAICFVLHWKITSDMWSYTLLDSYSIGSLTWNELILKSELFLLVSDHHLGSPLPLFPNMIPVPGVTVRPIEPLPDELHALITRSRDGIILVTFGSVTSHFPDSVLFKFLDSFSRLKQTVIAKLSLPTAVAVPKNVHVFQWLPQNDILSHQRTRLFITHCGSNGQHEALYHGVPMLGFPLFAEQQSNCERTRAKGFGLTMSVHNFTSAELFDNIQEILNNEAYRETIQRSSAVLRDEPLFGPKKAAHWIEHVMKYGSAHLRSPAMDLPIYRFLMFDVLAIFLIAAFIVIAVICICTVLVTRAIRQKLMFQQRHGRVKKLQ